MDCRRHGWNESAKIRPPALGCSIISIEQELNKDGLKRVPHADARMDQNMPSSAWVGQDIPLEISYEELADVPKLYEEKFRKIFGYFPGRSFLELHSLRIRAVGPSQEEQMESFEGSREQIKPSGKKQFLSREDIPVGAQVVGPCLVADNFGTLWIEDGWRATKGDRGSLLSNFWKLDVRRNKNFQRLPGGNYLPTVSFAWQRKWVPLERTALSVNVRERLDFSCALLDGSGYPWLMPPHVPVHLGALGVCARKIIETMPELQPGDIVVSNHPAFGGSHLPDVTVFAPVFAEGSDRPVAYLANRAHHAEIGGVSPGSMPASTNCLAEEEWSSLLSCSSGVGNQKLDEIEKLLGAVNYPSRQVGENMADLSAQVASLRLGMNAMEELLKEYGSEEISLRMAEMGRESADSCGVYLKNLGDCELRAEQFLDDGDRLSLRIGVADGRANFDFSGTSSVRKDGLNSTEAIVTSAGVLLPACLDWQGIAS